MSNVRVCSPLAPQLFARQRRNAFLFHVFPGNVSVCVCPEPVLASVLKMASHQIQDVVCVFVLPLGARAPRRPASGAVECRVARGHRQRQHAGGTRSSLGGPSVKTEGSRDSFSSRHKAVATQLVRGRRWVVRLVKTVLVWGGFPVLYVCPEPVWVK
jgi:hypothetical protein